MNFYKKNSIFEINYNKINNTNEKSRDSDRKRYHESGIL